MPDVSQRVKYSVEFDASSLAGFAEQVNKAKADVEAMLGTIKGLSEAFANLNGKTLKIKQTIVQQGDATKATTQATKDATAAAAKQASVVALLEKEFTAAGKAAHDMRIAQSRAALAQANASRVSGVLAQNIRKAKVALADMALHAKKVAGDIFNLEKVTRNLGAATEAMGLGFLKAFGKFQAARWIIQTTFDEIKKGAQNLDLKRVLAAQLDDYSGLVAEIERRTAGTIQNADLNKSLALMTSFGLSAESLPRSLELVAKAAVRTGQSTEYLTESFARGVSRMSPLILDNLGIQLKLTDAYDAFAKKVGKASDALTKNEQIMAVQEATLSALEKTTQGIVLSDTAGASTARFEKFFADIWTGITEVGGAALQQLDRLLEGTSTITQRTVEQLKTIDLDAMARMFDIPEKTIAAMPAAADAFASVTSEISKMSLLAYADKEGILNRMLNGSRTQDEARANMRESFNDVEGWLGRMRDASQADLFNSGIGGVLGNFLSADLSTMQAELRRVFTLVEEEKGRILTTEERSQVTAAVTLDIHKRLGSTLIQTNSLLAGEATTRADLEAMGKRLLVTDINRRDVFKSIAENALKANELANAGNVANARYVKSLIEAEILRDRELEYASQIHLLKLDENKAKAKELDLAKQIVATIKDYLDAEKTADRGANLAKLKQLELARQISAKQFQAASTLWDAEETRIKQIQKAGSAAVAAEIKRLQAIIKQNEAYLTQVDILNVMPGIAKVYTAVLRDANERLKDSVDMLKAATTGGSGTSRPREKSEPFVNQYKKTKETDLDRRAFDYAMKMQELMAAVPQRNKFLGLDTMFGLTDETMGKSIDGLVDLREDIKKTYGSLEVWHNKLYTLTNDTNFFDEMLPTAARLEDFLRHMERMKGVATTLNQIADAFGSVNNGLSGLTEAFGEDYKFIIPMMNDMTAALDNMSTAFAANASAYELTQGLVGVAQSVTKGLIKDLRVRAAFEALYQGALSVAAFAGGNYPGGIAHAVAAGMFAVIAGTSKKGASKKETKGLSGASNMQVARSDVHVYLSGNVVQTEADRGVMIQRAIREARAGGR